MSDTETRESLPEDQSVLTDPILPPTCPTRGHAVYHLGRTVVCTACRSVWSNERFMKEWKEKHGDDPQRSS